MAYNNSTINNVLNFYCQQINRPELINNYDKEFQFIYNSQLLNSFKNAIIGQFFTKDKMYVQVKKNNK